MALAGTAAAAPSRNQALTLLHANSAVLHSSNYDQFQVTDVITDGNGTVHIRSNRTYQGLRVLEGDSVLHQSRDGRVSASLTLGAPLNLNTHAKLSNDDALMIAGTKFGTGFNGMPTSELVVLNDHGRSAKLAYEVVYSGTKADQTPTEMHYVIDANTGKILRNFDKIETSAAPATFNTLYSGTVSATTNSITGGFELRDPTRGNGYTVNGAKGSGSGLIYTDTDNTWGNKTNSDKATAAADAQYGVGVTWDFYKNNFGRNGIANDGKGAYNKVHYGRNYVNAYWSDSCFCMTYGDGDGVTYSPLVNLDVAGHEMSHGVTSRTANLTYSGESGGLNEANSDIMGTMVEFYANNANDGGDYLIGEDIYITNPGHTKALRYMFQPSIEGNGTASSDCWYSGVGSLDVHYSSGPANHFYYLLAEGTAAKTFPGSTRVHVSPTCLATDTRIAHGSAALTGIGRDKAQQIWYKALTTYMTSGTNYAGARTATLNSATQLYGAASPEYAAVNAAWAAVGVK